MEVQLDKRYPVRATRAQCWAVLADIRAVAACMPGATITEQIDATHFKGTVRSKVGPAVMQFGGSIEVLAMDPATHSMQMLGKGADKSGSSASMNLTAHVEPGQTDAEAVLVGLATVTVSGKLAQFGSRLLVPVSDAMLAQFADNFRAAALAVPLDLGSSAQIAAAMAPGPTTAAETAAEAAMTRDLAPAAPALPSVAVAVAHAVADSAAGAPAAARACPAPAPAKELNALGLMWTVFKGWVAGLFGKRA
jgi:uncharacterized protein